MAARQAAEQPRRTHPVIAVDGKSVRGAIRGDGRCEHLLAAVDHRSGVVLAQLAVAAKTNEIPMLAPLLDRIAISGVVVTVDALHTQRVAAEYLHRRGAHYIFTVKDNQPRLRARLAALPWAQIPALISTNTGHGRIEERTVKVTAVQRGIGFPLAHLAIQITRDRRGRRQPPSREIVYAITDLSWEQTNPADLAAMIRGHWIIENQLHWVRDVTFSEDASTTRTGTSAQVKATMTNIAISLHRLDGATNIAAATRAVFRDPQRVWTVPGLVDTGG
ncbi:MAG: ISAs1 family transposase [Austwickia sp.]|nr:ISAs1 family transposase [Austwickia sp.]